MSEKRFKIFVDKLWIEYLKDIPENGVVNVIG